MLWGPLMSMSLCFLLWKGHGSFWKKFLRPHVHTRWPCVQVVQQSERSVCFIIIIIRPNSVAFGCSLNLKTNKWTLCWPDKSRKSLRCRSNISLILRSLLPPLGRSGACKAGIYQLGWPLGAGQKGNAVVAFFKTNTTEAAPAPSPGPFTDKSVGLFLAEFTWLGGVGRPWWWWPRW